MSEQIIQFPTRMRVKMRGRSISEMRATLKQFNDSIVASHTDALKSSTVELVDVGDYPEDHIIGVDGKVNWENATTEDRIWGLIGIRMASYQEGNEYALHVNCSRCDKGFTNHFDLRRVEDGGDLVMWEFEDEIHRAAFKEGAPFEGTLGERVIKWRMLYGSDEALMEKLSRNSPEIETDELSLNQRIIEVSGMHRNDVRGWIKQLGDERIDLMEMMTNATAGIDLIIDGKCPYCRATGEFTIPFDMEFWVPVMNKERDRRRARRARALEKAGRQ